MEEVNGWPTGSEFDRFSQIIPLPYRVCVIIVLGVWAWGLNLQYLDRVKIDVLALLCYPPHSSHRHPPHYLSTYRVAIFLTLPLAFSILLFWSFTWANPSAVSSKSILPNISLLILVISFLLPIRHIPSYNGRLRLLRTLKRISVGGLSEERDGRFTDVLLGDALVSYAKVLADLAVVFCMALTHRESLSSAEDNNYGIIKVPMTTTSMPDRSFWAGWLVPIVTGAPSAMRLRQCLIEYRRGVEQNYQNCNQHLANAAKYASAFPAITLAALIENSDLEKGSTFLFKCWVLTLVFNTIFSYYWDVSKDWDLSILSSNAAERTNPEYPYGLRRYRAFPSQFYYGAIGIDLILRCTWTFRLFALSGMQFSTPRLTKQAEALSFIFELLEILRRWIWLFFRIEKEWAFRIVQISHPAGGGDILLADSGHKFDEDVLNLIP